MYRTTALVASGRIYVLGGHDSAGGTTDAVHVIDPASGSARRAGTLPLADARRLRRESRRRILVFGGASSAVHDVVQQFSPRSGSVHVIGHMLGARADVTAVVVGRRSWAFSYAQEVPSWLRPPGER